MSCSGLGEFTAPSLCVGAHTEGGHDWAVAAANLRGLLSSPVTALVLSRGAMSGITCKGLTERAREQQTCRELTITTELRLCAAPKRGWGGAYSVV